MRSLFHRPVSTARDLLIHTVGDHYTLVACDTLAGIGGKAADALAVAPEVCARYTLRVCLSEIAAVGARPYAVLSLVCNEWSPTGQAVLAGIRRELDASGWHDLPVHGSTEENFASAQTAFGLSVLAEAERLTWRRSQPGDTVFLVGWPYVGAEVLAHADVLFTPALARRLATTDATGDILPCGSRGISRELDVLQAETGLRLTLTAPATVPLTKSAGPATCAIVTAHAAPVDLPLPVTPLGRLVHGPPNAPDGA